MKKELSERDICTKFFTPALVRGDKWDSMNQIREEVTFTKGRVVVRGQVSMGGDHRKRGFELERVMYDLFGLFDLDPKASVRITGEQIDGAFTISVFRHDADWDGLKKVWDSVCNGERNLHAVAVFRAAVVRAAQLDVRPEEPPARHANIVNWPWLPEDPELQKAKQKECAAVLAQAAQLVTQATPQAPAIRLACELPSSEPSLLFRWAPLDFRLTFFKSAFSDNCFSLRLTISQEHACS